MHESLFSGHYPLGPLKSHRLKAFQVFWCLKACLIYSELHWCSFSVLRAPCRVQLCSWIRSFAFRSGPFRCWGLLSGRASAAGGPLPQTAWCQGPGLQGCNHRPQGAKCEMKRKETRRVEEFDDCFGFRRRSGRLVWSLLHEHWDAMLEIEWTIRNKLLLALHYIQAASKDSFLGAQHLCHIQSNSLRKMPIPTEIRTVACCVACDAQGFKGLDFVD